MINFLYHKLKAKLGFTLAELLVVIGIIGILTTVGGIASMTVIRRAQAAKIVSDFRKIEGAWLEWRADTRRAYPHESDFYPYRQPANRLPEQLVINVDEPLIGETDLILNNELGVANYRGPYLASEPRDPFGMHYDYDNDGDTLSYTGCEVAANGGHNGAAGINRGVDVALHVCASPANQRYRHLAPIIDRAIDNSDGPCAGRFRWQITSLCAALQYSIDPGP